MIGRAVDVLGVNLFVARTATNFFFDRVGVLVQGQNNAVGYQHPYKQE